MSSIFMTTYEVNEAGASIIAEHRAAINAYMARCWAIVEEIGAKGFQPAYRGIRSIIFKGQSSADTPEGWRYLERDPDKSGVIRCVPRKTSKAGRALAERLASVGPLPRGEEVASEFGWSPPVMAMDGNRIFFPVQQSVELPEPRHFLRLPRFEGDNWQGHDGLTAIPESEFMRALEEHNACVRAASVDGEPS